GEGGCHLGGGAGRRVGDADGQERGHGEVGAFAGCRLRHDDDGAAVQGNVVGDVAVPETGGRLAAGAEGGVEAAVGVVAGQGDFLLAEEVARAAGDDDAAVGLEGQVADAVVGVRAEVGQD